MGAEFTCHFPEVGLFCHVLACGFDREQEVALDARRQNYYDFLRFAAARNIPVVLPHPLYFYTRNKHIDLELFEKQAVMFQRFEVLNGQRDLWQSTLTLNGVQSLNPDQIRAYARKHKLDPAEFGVDPDRPGLPTCLRCCRLVPLVRMSLLLRNYDTTNPSPAGLPSPAVTNTHLLKTSPLLA